MNIYQYYGISNRSLASSILATKYGVASIEGMIILGTVVYMVYGRLLAGRSLSLNQEGYAGTLEPLFLTPANRLTILLANGVSSLIDAGWMIVIVFLAGWLLFGFNLGTGSLLIISVATLSTIIALLAFSTFLSSFFLASRNADQMVGLIQGPIRFFSGTTFPVSAIPSLLQPVSYLIPVTYAVEVLRDSVYTSVDAFGLIREFGILYFVTAILFALSYLSVKTLENHAKRTGRLSVF